MDGAFCFKNGTQLSRLIDETSYIARALDPVCHRLAVASLMRISLPHINMIFAGDIAVNENGYAKQIVHVDPDSRFSVIAIKWMPGAATPVHGHNAWGCVGVLSGEIGCETFAHKHEDTPCDSAHADDLTLTGRLLAGPGTVATVDPDPCGIHRLFNPTGAEAMTLHIYGMNLALHPDGLNKWYPRQQ